ncbi:MAG: endo-1,4-beta-xylanase [Phycisphaerae bacterium]
MLQFDVFQDGQPAPKVDLEGALAFGQDAIPLRAELVTEDGKVSCIKRVPGACGLQLLWDAGPSGRFMLPTTRLPEKRTPYNLNLELARGQLCRIAQKREDWGLFDFPEAARLTEEYDHVRGLFIEALKTSDPGRQAKLADQCLAQGVTLGEKMALFHAEVLLSRRKAANVNTWRPAFGCMVDMLSTGEDYSGRLRDVFDFISVPMSWKTVEPKEHQYQFTAIDSWINWAARNRKFIHAGPLLSFDPASLPEWLYIWEHDYDTVRDLIYEHIQRVVKRYKRQVNVWNVISGIHAHNSFNLSFEQLMELTRMTCLVVKKIAPQSKVMIDLVQPWGEYYARNQRTIPPMLYADMAVQSGIKFDTFGLQLYMGVPVDGLFVRDLLQVSSLLDEFAGLGKSVHVTACEVPSDMASDAWDAWDGKENVADAGTWHAPWSQRLQAEWLQAFCRVCISKPYVEGICWRDLADYEGHYIPHGGLCRNDLEPKLAYKELRNFKAFLTSGKFAEKRSAPEPE